MIMTSENESFDGIKEVHSTSFHYSPVLRSSEVVRASSVSSLNRVNPACFKVLSYVELDTAGDEESHEVNHDEMWREVPDKPFMVSLVQTEEKRKRRSVSPRRRAASEHDLFADLRGPEPCHFSRGNYGRGSPNFIPMSCSTDSLHADSVKSLPFSPGALEAYEDDLGNNTEALLHLARTQLPEAEIITAFSETDKHSEITLSYRNHLAEKTGSGLYRTVRADKPLPLGQPVYFEMVLFRNTEDKTMCVGVSTTDLNHKSIVGNTAESIGFHSQGSVVHKGKWTSHKQHAFTSGILGCLVTATRAESSTEIKISFFHNGLPLTGVQEAPVVFPTTKDIYPTLSMIQDGTQVLGQFSSAHLRHTSQLPPDTVALDGLPVDRSAHDGASTPHETSLLDCSFASC